MTQSNRGTPPSPPPKEDHRSPLQRKVLTLTGSAEVLNEFAIRIGVWNELQGLLLLEDGCRSGRFSSKMREALDRAITRGALLLMRGKVASA